MALPVPAFVKKFLPAQFEAAAAPKPLGEFFTMEELKNDFFAPDTATALAVGILTQAIPLASNGAPVRGLVDALGTVAATIALKKGLQIVESRQFKDDMTGATIDTSVKYVPSFERPTISPGRGNFRKYTAIGGATLGLLSMNFATATTLMAPLLRKYWQLRELKAGGYRLNKKTPAQNI